MAYSSCISCLEIPSFVAYPPSHTHTRCHTVDEFNRGIYDYVIATDEAHSPSTVATSSGAGAGAGAETEGGRGRGKGGKRKKDREYGVSRGIDFQGVENVINFDFPPSSNAYVHRVGRLLHAQSYMYMYMCI